MSSAVSLYCIEFGINQAAILVLLRGRAIQGMVIQIGHSLENEINQPGFVYNTLIMTCGGSNHLQQLLDNRHHWNEQTINEHSGSLESVIN